MVNRPFAIVSVALYFACTQHLFDDAATGNMDLLAGFYHTEELMVTTGPNPPTVRKAVIKNSQLLHYETLESFLAPRVRQDRNAHQYLGDFKAELDLYLKAGKLLEYLSTWSPSRGVHATLPERMEELWIDLYERGYIELADVTAMQLWIRTLIEMRYSFPPIVREPPKSNLVVMGQLNHGDIETDKVVFWTQKWKCTVPTGISWTNFFSPARINARTTTVEALRTVLVS